MNLSNIKPPAGQQKKQKRVGRGMGSGRSKTSGRGHKGARSISGYSKMRGFEGGQMPLHRRLPKRGFTNIFKKDYAVVNVGDLNELEGAEFTPDSLREAGLVRNMRDGVKILGSGDLTRAITVRAHLFSKSAQEKITAAGGKTELIESRQSQGE